MTRLAHRGHPAVTSHHVELMRDCGGDFWRWPKFETWRAESGWRFIRLGWRWTAWAIVAYPRIELSAEQADEVIARAEERS